jgi:hypothetical protein
MPQFRKNQSTNTFTVWVSGTPKPFLQEKVRLTLSPTTLVSNSLKTRVSGYLTILLTILLALRILSI